jgi:hypothetical protein
MSTSNTQTVNLSRAFAMARFAEPHLASAPRDASPTSPLMIGSMASSLDGSRTLAGMLLAASIAALLVVADQVIDTWVDGHLLVGWVALWTVAFATLALLAPPLRQVSAFVASSFVRHLVHLRVAQAQARMWELAAHDPRVLEEIRAAVARHAE